MNNYPKSILITVLIVLSIAVIIAIVQRFSPHTELGVEVASTATPALNSFSSPSSEAATSDRSVVRFYSCIERQRIMRDEKIYHGEIDGDRGPLTIAAEAEHNRLYGDWCAKETAR